MEALLDSLFGQYLAAIGKPAEDGGRGARRPRRRPLRRRRALAAGLVDELVYEDELQERLDDAEKVTPGRYVKRLARLRLDGRPKIALVYVVGEIMPGEGGQRPSAAPSPAPTRWPEALRKAPRGRRHPGHHPARGQPRGIGHGLGRDLARGGARAEGEAGHHVDGRRGGVGRLLHGHGQRRDRGPAEHHHRLDRRFRRQVQPGGPVRQAGAQQGDVLRGRTPTCSTRTAPGTKRSGPRSSR